MASASPDPLESGGEGAGGGEGTDQAEADRAFEVRSDSILDFTLKRNKTCFITLKVKLV